MRDRNKKVKKDTPLSRREAMTRMGLSAFSAATMMMLLGKPAKAQDWVDSPDLPPDWP